jgi:glutathione S-transferase
VIRLYGIPYSTNVERVTLALAHKGLDVDYVEIDPDDRSPVRELSGQERVPVLVHDGRVITDSTAILEFLEERYPDPPLYPRDEARRAEVTIFVDWFNRVWKRWPNEIEGELVDGPTPDEERLAILAVEFSGSRDRFEELLAGRDYLFGEFSVADCAAFPFLKYALIWHEDDDHLFHRILVDHLRLDSSYPRLEAWIRRVDERPRAV